MEKENKTFQAGTIVTIPAVTDCPEFIVLDDYGDGTALCITKDTVGLQRFAEDNRIAYDAENLHTEERH